MDGTLGLDVVRERWVGRDAFDDKVGDFLLLCTLGDDTGWDWDIC